MNSSTHFPQFNEDFSLKDVTTYYVGSLESSAHRSVRAYKDKCLKEFGLTGMQWYIIGAVHDSGEKGTRITDLSNKLGTTLGFMTNSINLLESKSILYRLDSSSDSRSKLILIEPEYKSTCQEIEEKLRIQLRKTIYKNLTADDLKAYIKTLQILANIDQE